MAQFKYVAVDAKGNEKSGVIEADNEAAVVSRLREQGLFPTQVGGVSQKKGRAVRQPTPAAPSAGKGLKMELHMPAFLVRVGPKQIMLFTRQLATLVNAGLPLLRALRVVQKQERNSRLRRVIGELADSIESGSTFAEALAQHPRIFSKLFVNMVHAGEVGGVLDVVLNRLAEFMEKAQKIKSKIVSAMVYPVVVLVMAVTILTLLMIFIVPKFQQIFQDLLEGAQLPAMTRMVLGVSQTMTHRLPFVILGVAAFVMIVKLMAKLPGGKYAVDWTKLHLPIFGTLVQKTAIARFARTLGTLMTSGVPLLQALNIVRETVQNDVIAKAIMLVHDSVKEGENVAPPMEASRVFPPMVVSMVEVGEETGGLPEMLMKVADSYEEDVDNTVVALTSIIEPILIIFLALIVGSIVIALFLPLVSIIGKLS
jgi:type IV pilus assembly protein PilC